MTSAEAKPLIPPFFDFAKTLQGDKMSETKTFLDRLFRALGHDGANEAGATFEYRTTKKPGSSQLSLFKDDDHASAPKLKGGAKFADLLWPSRVNTTTGSFITGATSCRSARPTPSCATSIYDFIYLLDLNHACGEKITPLCLPLPPEEHAAFVTQDCIQPPTL